MSHLTANSRILRGVHENKTKIVVSKVANGIVATLRPYRQMGVWEDLVRIGVVTAPPPTPCAFEGIAQPSSGTQPYSCEVLPRSCAGGSPAWSVLAGSTVR